MRKVIKDIVYDTEEDMEIAKYQTGDGDTYISETLYLTDKKELYIYGIGGRNTIYKRNIKKGANMCEDIEVVGGDGDADISFWINMNHKFLSQKDINNIRIISSCIYG